MRFNWKTLLPLVALLYLLPGRLAAQNEDKVYFLVERYPEYPGGANAMYAYLDTSVVYPDEALKEGVEGVVRVKAVIDTNGKVVSAYTDDELEGGLSDEALRVVEEMPAWSPGYMHGHRVKVMVIIPIRFAIGSSDEEEQPQKQKKHRKG